MYCGLPGVMQSVLGHSVVYLPSGRLPKSGIGDTQCFNPGSEYVQGTLNGWIVALKGGKLSGYQHTSG